MPDNQTPNIFAGNTQNPQEGPQVEQNQPIVQAAVTPAQELSNEEREKLSQVTQTPSVQAPIQAEPSKPEIKMEIDADKDDTTAPIESTPPVQQAVQESAPEQQASSATSATANEQVGREKNEAMNQETTSVKATIDDDLTPQQKLMAALAYMNVLVMIPITNGQKDDFVDFHIRQGLALTGTDFFALFLLAFIARIPLGILGALVMLIIVMGGLAIHGFMIVKALSGEKWLIPNIGPKIQTFDIEKWRAKKTKVSPDSGAKAATPAPAASPSPTPATPEINPEQKA